MVQGQSYRLGRRAFLTGTAAAGVLLLPGCASLGGPVSLTEVIRRLLTLSSRNAFARLTAPGRFWDDQVARLDLPEAMGRRGSALQNVLSSALFRDRLRREFAGVAERASRRAAPLVADTVRTIGIDNALALMRGGPSAATAYLRGAMAGALIEAILPELNEGLRIADDPLMGQLLNAVAGVDVSAVARELAGQVDDAIWREIGKEEAAIRANPEATRDPVLIGALKLL